MASAQAGRRTAYALALLGLLFTLAPNANAIEAFDGRIQAHGFGEMQIRALDRDFAEDIDLAQWYNVFNLELEADILPDGWGPFDLLQAYVRVEARYDAIYSNGFGMFPSVSTFGNSSKRLPLRLRDALDQDYSGVINSNAQADPPGSVVFRVPEAGDLDPSLGYRHPRDTLRAPAYRERDPVGWVIESISAETIDYQRDENGDIVPDQKNPMDPTDLVSLYRREKTGVPIANPSLQDFMEAALENDPLVLEDYSVYLLDPLGDLVLDDGEPVIGCGELRPGGSGNRILCRGLPENGSRTVAVVAANQPAFPNNLSNGAAGSDREAHHLLLDRGNQRVTDPLTRETLTVAELYGDVLFVGRDAEGNLIPADGPNNRGQARTGLASRVSGASITDDSSQAEFNGSLEVDPPDFPVNPPNPGDPSGFGSGGDARLVGFNGTCTTNRTDTRDPYAKDAMGAFEYDLATRQAILTSGVEGTCVGNRLDKTSIVKRRAFPGFDALFDQEGADAELGVNIDAANPALANRTSPVSAVIGPINEILAAVPVPGGCPDVANGGLRACGLGARTEERFQAEQLILNEVAPYFRGIARERDDPAFYALENVIKWRFTTREIKGAQGGAGATLLMGPWLPKNFFQTNATLADRANPFRSRGTPTVVARLSSDDFAGQTGNFFEQSARAAGDRYHALDVTALEMAIEDADFELAPDSRAARYITDEACPPGPAGTGCKVIETIFPGPGVSEQVIVGLDLSNANFAPDPIDPRVARLDELVALLGQTGVRLRRQREINTGSGVRTAASQSRVGPYPNEVLQLGDFVDSRGQLLVPFSLLERSGELFATASSSFGGDFSGILPCQNTAVAISRQSAPQLATFEGRMAGFDFQPSFNGDPALGGSSIGCIPFTNLLAAGGAGELPLRPAADVSNLIGVDFLTAQGNYIPSQGLLRALETVDFDDPQFNFGQAERSWNRGASQSDTFEVKEAYADMEFLDSRLWIRFGLQNIVWGKTELFRTTDQFNPQDLALASLPSLEESRIAVLSGRAVYSLYDVGPLEDVRVEIAANFDRMKPADLGACGEPYTIDVVCGLTAGFAFHGITGLGVAGTDRPPDAWNDIDGVEFGGRIEFRWDRFSFAIVDFYGYNDFPYPKRISSYFRDVDTQTGRLRKAFAAGPCENAGGFIDWQPVPATQIGGAFDPLPPAQYQTWSAGNTRLAGEVDLVARRALLNPGIGGDPTALPTGANTADPLDDWVKHPLAYTIQGIGIDPGCLKPGGIAGGPNENRFDTRLAPNRPLQPLFDADGNFDGIDANGDGVKDFDSFANQDPTILPTDRRTFFNNSTMGQWEREGFSVDDALRWHPGNQQIFSLTCLGTVSIIAALDPAACAWTLFGSPGVVVSDKTLGEVVSVLGAGDVSSFTIGFINVLLSQTKGDAAAEFNNFLPIVALNRDARDGLTGAVNSDITGDDPFNPGDLEDWLTLGNTLSAQQQALLGCGPFFGTRCDSGSFYNTTAEAADFLVRGLTPRLAPPARPFYDVRFAGPSQGQVLELQAGVGGLDVLGTEPSALVQSVPGFEGSAEVKGTFTRLVRRDDGELLRVGDGTPGLDLTTCGDVGDPCVAPDLLDPTLTRFTSPASYQVQRDELAAFELGLEILQSNPLVPPTMDLSDPACPIVVNGIVDDSCAGLEQIVERISILQATGDIGPGGANQAEYDELTMDDGQYDRQVDEIGSDGDGAAVDSQFGLIRNQEGVVAAEGRNVLATFRVGGNDPGNPGNEDRSAFGRPFQVLDEDDRPIEVGLNGNIVDGLEEFGPVNSHVTWSNTPQPGTLGNAGLVDIEREFVLGPGGDPEDPDGSGQFATEITGGAGVVQNANPYFGGPVCTRFDPESPYADGNGIVKLPGCRGASSVSINTAAPPLFRGPSGELLSSDYGTNIYDIREESQYAGTVEVIYEDFYDPRVDGCIFGPTLRSRDNMQTAANEEKIYKVQAVNRDGTFDNLTQTLLDATCFNTGLAGVSSTTQMAPALLGGDFQALEQGDLDAFGNAELDLAADGTITRAALAGFETTPSTFRRAEDPLRRYAGNGNDQAQAFAATLFHPWASCMQSSPLFGTAITGNQFNLNGSSAARSRPWAVDSASPLADQRGSNLILEPENGLFVLDAGVGPDAADARENGTEAAVSRSKFLCDARTRDLENDFFEGTLRQDLDGDGLIAAGAQVFSNEMASVSWNLLMFLTASSCNSVSGGDDLDSKDCFQPATPWALDRCSFSTPQFCRNVKGIIGVAGVNRNNYRAGGNGVFGRRDFLWHSGGEITLNYARRNVFGISADFAEDVTKTNWGMEFTWIGPQPFFDNNSFDNTTSSHSLNLTVSVDRPTFINFLNANRTFFMNSQWFFQYLTDHNTGFFNTGPFNALFTFAVFTGYYQDRLLPQVVTVYDFRSQSGGFLPQVSYRFTEAFSITVGVSFFIGRGERIVMPVNGIGPTINRAGPNAYEDGTERLLSLIRGRDEAFMRVRWTF